MTQGAGGGIMAGGTLSSMNTGEKIITAGLFLQIIFFGCFVVCSTIFHARCAKRPTSASMDCNMPWQRMVTMLYVVSGLILVRSAFRVIEYIQGNDGALLRVEWPTYTFDALLMASTMLVFLIWYPADLGARVKKAGNEGSDGFGQLESFEGNERPQATV